MAAYPNFRSSPENGDKVAVLVLAKFVHGVDIYDGGPVQECLLLPDRYARRDLDCSMHVTSWIGERLSRGG